MDSVSYGCQFNMLLISRSHEDENADLTVFELTAFLCDILRVFSRWDAVSQTVSVPWTDFCGSSNRFLGSMLVMFLRARHWQVGACVIHIQPAKRTLRMSTKLAFLPTFILPVAEIVPPPMCDRMLRLALFTEQRLDQPISPYRGVISDRVGKTSQPLWQSRR